MEVDPCLPSQSLVNTLLAEEQRHSFDMVLRNGVKWMDTRYVNVIFSILNAGLSLFLTKLNATLIWGYNYPRELWTLLRNSKFKYDNFLIVVVLFLILTSWTSQTYWMGTLVVVASVLNFLIGLLGVYVGVKIPFPWRDSSTSRWNGILTAI